MLKAQEVEAERYTRLVRKQEVGAGPLRYSIELRRSAGALSGRLALDGRETAHDLRV